MRLPPPGAHARDAHAPCSCTRWYLRRWPRLALLSTCLAAAVLALLGTDTDLLSGSGSGGAAGAAWCTPHGAPEVTRVGLAQVVALRGTLLGVIRAVGGRRIGGGVVDGSAMWNDDPGRPVGAARLDARMWPGGYEIRQSARTGDVVAADVLLFADAARARAFFVLASATVCRSDARSVAVAQPVGARGLTWTNPDSTPQQDVFLLDGPRVFRVVDVRPQELIGDGPLSERRAGLAIAGALACRLPRARCR